MKTFSVQSNKLLCIYQMYQTKYCITNLLMKCCTVTKCSEVMADHGHVERAGVRIHNCVSS